MKKWCMMICVIMSVFLIGCSSDPKELYDTAKLEETQMSYDQARKIYQQIIEKYPDSEYAKQAKERLAVLDRK